MSFTQTDIDALEAAIARGVRKVKQGDEEVEYRSLSEMKETLRMMKASVQSSGGRPIRVTYPRTTRGL